MTINTKSRDLNGSVGVFDSIYSYSFSSVNYLRQLLQSFDNI